MRRLCRYGHLNKKHFFSIEKERDCVYTSLFFVSCFSIFLPLCGIGFFIFLFQHQFLELGVTFLILQEQVEFELSIAGTFGDTLGFEFLKRLPHQTVCKRVLHTERGTLGSILYIDIFQHFIYNVSKLLRLLLRGLQVGKLIVEMVGR